MLEKPVNPNYTATVVQIKNRFPLENCDNVEGTSIFGYSVIVGKGTENLGVFFPVETQLSDAFLYNNNLYRHADKNKNPDEKGYFEDNRRVRATKFRSLHVSQGFFVPLSCLTWTGIDVSLLKEGDEFDTLNGHEICRKYQVRTNPMKTGQQVDRGFVRADSKFMPEHIDTENFFKNSDKIDPNTRVVVTQKIHGTSIRIANTMVNRKPSFVERVAQYFGAKIAKTEYAYLYGSRKVIKDANNPNQNHYYSTDIWTNEGRKLDGVLPENYIVYGELVGWTPEGAPIQKGYTYGLPVGECQLYIYRIAIVNEKGLTTDLHWDQVKEFCNKNGLKHVPEMLTCIMLDLVKDEFQTVKQMMDVRYFEDLWGGCRNALWLGENKDVVDEGICIRAEGLTPKILKAKSPKFLEHETKILDEGKEDLESTQS